MAHCVKILADTHGRWMRFAHDMAGRPKDTMLDIVREHLDCLPYRRCDLRENDVVLWDTIDGTLHLTVYNAMRFHYETRGIRKSWPLRTFAKGVGPVWIIREKEIS